MAMTTGDMRERLIAYLTDAEENKVNALYTLLENAIEENASYELTDEQYHILQEERAEYLRGEGKSYTREESVKIIRGERDF